MKKNPSKNDIKKGLRVEFILEEGGRTAEGTVVGRDGNWFLIAFDENHNYKPWVSAIISSDDQNNLGVSDQYVGREARWACTKEEADSEYITEILSGGTQQVKDMTDILHREIIHGFDCIVYDNKSEDSYCIAVGPFYQEYRKIECVGPNQNGQHMAKHPVPETPGVLPFQEYYAQFAMCGRDLAIAKERLQEMADRLKDEFGEREEKNEPMWTIFDKKDGELLLVRNPSPDEAAEVARAVGFDYKDYAQDKTTHGEAWGELKNRWGVDNWTKDGTPSEFELKKIAKCDNVQIVDHLGKDIKGEYLVNDKLTKAKEIVVSSAKDMGGAGALGLKLAGARRMNKVAYDQVLRPLMQKSGMGHLADDQKVRATALMLLPLVLHPLASAFEDRIPYAGQVKGGLELSFTETVRENSDQLLEFAEQLFKMMYIANNLNEQSATRIDINYDKYEKEGLEEIAHRRHLRIPEEADREALLELLQEHDQEEALAEATANEKARVG